MAIFERALPGLTRYYAYDDVQIGTWIDGKPLYRKVLNVISPNEPCHNEIILPEIELPPIDQLVNMSGIAYSPGTGQWSAIPIMASEEFRYILLYDGNLSVSVGQDFVGEQAYIFLEYTRASDGVS